MLPRQRHATKSSSVLGVFVLSLLLPGMGCSKKAKARIESDAGTMASVTQPTASRGPSHAWEDHLASKDPSLRYQAIYDLVTSHQASAEPLLAQAGGNADPAISVLALAGLGAWQKPSLLTALLDLAPHITEPRARRELVWAVGQYPDARSAELLVRICESIGLNDPDRDALHRGIADALLRQPESAWISSPRCTMGATGLALGSLPNPPARFWAALGDTVTPHFADLVAAQKDCGGVGHLVTLLSESEPEIMVQHVSNAHARDALERLHPGCEAALREIANAGDSPAILREALPPLTAYARPADVKILETHAHGKQREVATLAARLLRKMGRPVSGNSRQAPNPDVADLRDASVLPALIRAVLEAKTDSSISPLLQSLAEATKQLNLSLLLRSLQGNQDRESGFTLAESISSESVAARISTTRDWPNPGAPNAVAALLALGGSIERDILLTATNLGGKFTNPSATALKLSLDRATTAALASLLDGSTGPAKAALYAALARREDAEARRLAVQGLSSADRDIRLAIVRAAATTTSGIEGSDLRAALNDADSIVASAALDSLAKMGPRAASAEWSIEQAKPRESTRDAWMRAVVSLQPTALESLLVSDSAASGWLQALARSHFDDYSINESGRRLLGQICLRHLLEGVVPQPLHLGCSFVQTSDLADALRGVPESNEAKGLTAALSSAPVESKTAAFTALARLVATQAKEPHLAAFVRPFVMPLLKSPLADKTELAQALLHWFDQDEALATTLLPAFITAGLFGEAASLFRRFPNAKNAEKATFALAARPRYDEGEKTLAAAIFEQQPITVLRQLAKSKSSLRKHAEVFISYAHAPQPVLSNLDAEVSQGVRSLLADPQTVLRQVAASVLARTTDATLLPEIRQRLQTEQEDYVRAPLIVALLRQGGLATIGEALGVLNAASNRTVSRYVGLALARDPAIPSWFLTHVAVRDGFNASVMAEVIARRPTDPIAILFPRVVEAYDYASRWLPLANETGQTHPLAGVISALHHPEPTAEDGPTAASLYLGRHHVISELPALLGHLCAQPDPLLASFATDAFEDAELAAALKHERAAVRACTLRLLAARKPPKLGSYLAEALNDASSDVVRMALRIALGQKTNVIAERAWELLTQRDSRVQLQPWLLAYAAQNGKFTDISTFSSQRAAIASQFGDECYPLLPLAAARHAALRPVLDSLLDGAVSIHSSECRLGTIVALAFDGTELAKIYENAGWRKRQQIASLLATAEVPLNPSYDGLITQILASRRAYDSATVSTGEGNLLMWQPKAFRIVGLETLSAALQQGSGSTWRQTYGEVAH